jgi:hypothetical protein
MTDVWTHWLGKMIFLQADPVQEVLVEARGSRVDNTRMTLIGGEKAGEVWGSDDNRIFVESADGKREFTDDQITLLHVKNPPALVLLPLRLAWADKVAYVGPIEFEGKTYERVFATWETFDSNMKYDQWVVWIDPETGNIAKAKCTVREYQGAMGDEAVVEVSDYKWFGDVMIPTKISGVFDFDETDPVRTWTVKSFEWTNGEFRGPARATAQR